VTTLDLNELLTEPPEESKAFKHAWGQADMSVINLLRF
jgi:hypothetical protein